MSSPSPEPRAPRTWSLLARSWIHPALVATMVGSLALPWVAIERDVDGNVERFRGLQRIDGSAGLRTLIVVLLFSLGCDIVARLGRARALKCLAHLGCAFATFATFTFLDFMITFTLFARAHRLVGGLLALAVTGLAIIRSVSLAAVQVPLVARRVGLAEKTS
jgi:hypothetical protein